MRRINSVDVCQEVGHINQVGLDCPLQLGLESSTTWLSVGLFHHNYAAGDSPLLGTALKDVCSLRVCKAGLRLSHTLQAEEASVGVNVYQFLFQCVCASWCAVFELTHIPLSKPPSSSCLSELNYMDLCEELCVCVGGWLVGG